MKPSRNGVRLISNIITTNKNNTITAPTYTKTRAMARNSACNNNQMPEDEKNASTKNSAAWTGLRTVITRTAAKIKIAANRKKMTFIIVFVVAWCSVGLGVRWTRPREKRADSIKLDGGFHGFSGRSFERSANAKL